jgi:hypothetical protein
MIVIQWVGTSFSSVEEQLAGLPRNRESSHSPVQKHITSALAANKSIWLHRLLCKIGQDQPNPTILNTDNQASISLAQNPVFHKATKHIEVHYHHMRHCFESGIIVLTYISTNDQLADILMIPLPKDKHKRLANAMGLFWR